MKRPEERPGVGLQYDERGLYVSPKVKRRAKVCAFLLGLLGIVEVVVDLVTP